MIFLGELTWSMKEFTYFGLKSEDKKEFEREKLLVDQDNAQTNSIKTFNKIYKTT